MNRNEFIKNSLVLSLAIAANPKLSGGILTTNTIRPTTDGVKAFAGDNFLHLATSKIN